MTCISWKREIFGILWVAQRLCFCLYFFLPSSLFLSSTPFSSPSLWLNNHLLSTIPNSTLDFRGYNNNKTVSAATKLTLVPQFEKHGHSMFPGHKQVSIITKICREFKEKHIHQFSWCRRTQVIIPSKVGLCS